MEIIEGSFWSSKQRQALSIHEISYRASFKPELPKYFIENYSTTNDIVYDPFCGRGSVPIEACYNGRIAMGNDINPLSIDLTYPRINPPRLKYLERYLEDFEFKDVEIDESLLVFFHPQTLKEITNFRNEFKKLKEDKEMEIYDYWVNMVCLNRLTGHSKGFFSVYSLPPNLQASIESQKKINKDRNQVPEYRNTKELILKKSKSLLKDITEDIAVRYKFCYLYNQEAHNVTEVEDKSIGLVITSPPFLDQVDYKKDNWLRCWFAGIDLDKVNISNFRGIEDWTNYMSLVIVDIHRVLENGKYCIFEVGETKGYNLEEYLIPVFKDKGFDVEKLMINKGEFTKTAHIFGVDNNSKGTNSNRIIVMKKI